MNATRCAEYVRENSRLRTINRALTAAVLVLAASLVVTLAIMSPVTLAWMFGLAATLILAASAAAGLLGGCKDRQRYQL